MGIEPPAQVPEGNTKAEWGSSGQAILCSEVDRARALHRRSYCGALTRAIHAQLNDLVAESGVESLRDRDRVGGSEYDVARKNDSDHLPQIICDLLLTEVEHADGKRRGSIGS